jgi:hypothetical protein
VSRQNVRRQVYKLVQPTLAEQSADPFTRHVFDGRSKRKKMIVTAVDLVLTDAGHKERPAANSHDGSPQTTVTNARKPNCLDDRF